ncbi:hypothetical protein BO83DRAFT_109312 [Aspergillus eucalypticola CBS 122712]|uniref:Secreted protein n=1 Tax=Aspergillus eucalypticola (strain CBS 122712 / IBT 29274) TaxID=1448314 RepID=A0A317V011_ASPEC|nr:uncharacterized protein BO83DRAFT_109312 [Aspergillus eucalypticola CBS 122712]PWY66701.1 hypothetical protein BO83DRAFT_109312 [Aspergillus eucalypticola CBS 122712]
MPLVTTLSSSLLVSCLTFAAWRRKYIQGLRLMGMDQPWGSRAFPFGGGRRVGDTVKNKKVRVSLRTFHSTHSLICVCHCDSVLLLFIFSCAMKGGGEGEREPGE